MFNEWVDNITRISKVLYMEIHHLSSPNELLSDNHSVSEVSIVNVSHKKGGDNNKAPEVKKPDINLPNYEFEELVNNQELDFDKLARRHKNNTQELDCNCQLTCKAFALQLSELQANRIYIILYSVLYFAFVVVCLLYSPQENATLSDVANYIQMGLQAFFTFTIVVKMLNWSSQEKAWLVLDVLTNVAAYLAFMVPNDEALNYLKAFRTLRIIIGIRYFTFLYSPAADLMYSLQTVGKILFPAFLFIYIYALISLFSFSDYEYSRCRDPANKFLSKDWTVYTDEIYLCGERACPVVNGVQLECLNPIDFGVEPNQDELNNIVQGFGLLHYRNIFFSLFSTFKQTFGTGSSRHAVLNKQVTSEAYVLVLNLSFIYLLSYIYLNIFYGLLMTVDESDMIEEEKERTNLGSAQKIQEVGSIKDEKHHTIRGERKRSVLSKYSQKNIEEPRKSTQQLSIIPLHKQASPPQAIDEIQEVDFKESHKSPLKKISIDANTAIKELEEKKNEDATKEDPQKMRWQEHMKRYLIFNHIIVVLTALNLALDFQDQSTDFSYIVDILDFAFYLMFMIELLVRIPYEKCLLNRDINVTLKTQILIGALCTVGVIYDAIDSTDARSFLLANTIPDKLFRSLKYLRLVVLILSTPYFKEAKLILLSTLETVYNVKNTIMLWCIMMLTFAIMGFHLFGLKTKVDSQQNLDLENGQSFPINFDTKYNSIIFTMMTFFNEEWDYFTFQQYVGTGAYIVIWQLVAICIGLTILSKYFMALLMKKLGERLDEEPDINIKDDSSEGNQLESELSSFKTLQKFGDTNKVTPEPIMIRVNSGEPKQSTKQMKMDQVKDDGDSSLLAIKPLIRQRNSRIINPMEEHGAEQAIEKEKHERQKADKSIKRIVSNEDTVSKVKLTLYIILKHKVYVVLRMGIVVASCLCLALSHPRDDPNSQSQQVVAIFFYIFNFFFLLETLVSMFTYGIFKGKSSYFRRSWVNWLNVALNVIEILSFTALSETPALHVLLRFRALRLVSFIELQYNSDKNMKLTIIAFSKLMPRIVNLLTVTLIIYGFFAVILVKLYKNDFYYCENYEDTATIVNHTDCLNWGGDWIKRSINASNFLNSLLFLFLVATTEGWSTLMIIASSLKGDSLVPQYGSNSWIQGFFMVFFFFGNLIMLNVFIGLSIYNFNKIKDQVTGEAKLDKNEKLWMSIQKQIYRLKPPIKDYVPENQLRKLCFLFQNSQAYKIIKIVLFILYLVSMSLFRSNMNETFFYVLTYIVYSFVGVFFLEYLIHILGNYGGPIMFTSKFFAESLMVMYSIVYFCLLNGFSKKQLKIYCGILMALQLMRFFSVLNDIEFIRKMFNSLLTILPETFNIFSIIVIVLFIYTVIGIQFFAYLKPNVELNEFDQNYKSFSSALYALIKFSTLESPINQITEAAESLSPHFVCFEINTYTEYKIYGDNGCGNAAKSYIFFLSFHLLYTLVLMSTLMAVIFDAYRQVRYEEEAMVNKFQLQTVEKEWLHYDPESTGYLSYRDFWIFTSKLVTIYNVNGKQLLSHATKDSFLKALSIPIYEDEKGILSFQFHEVIIGLTKIVIKVKENDRSNKANKDKFFEHLFKKSEYDSSHVQTLIMLKVGLKKWKKKAVSEEKTGFAEKCGLIAGQLKNEPKKKTQIKIQ